ncbi:hypothetical protein BDV95DRAFT_580873 [Massariosphaeria phaeospora]|uniref:Uncharacterized protein n=1 Tax=Massariosphaeria phaeospora TaxID=100035 RepID=A0A7C8MF46_9PLEO|nr:hypothetical protein BDV95DRAFT_580873 [Massariosphaeria phaeospora]
MHELISHPSLKFHIFQLSGRLTYTLSINNKPPKHFELLESDFENLSPQVKVEAPAPDVPGTDASAVGLHLRIVKNDGVLEMVYEEKGEGGSGTKAEWKFEGLTAVSRSAAETYATAATQREAQSSASVATQTASELGRPDHEQQAASDIEPVKAEDSEETRADLWPRHMYLRGHFFGSSPSLSSQFGELHIDRTARRLHWQHTSGEDFNERTVQQAIDLRNPLRKFPPTSAPPLNSTKHTHSPPPIRPRPVLQPPQTLVPCLQRRGSDSTDALPSPARQRTAARS